MGITTGYFSTQAIAYGYLKFKPRYLKSLELFSIRVKQLYDPIAFRNKQRVFTLSKSIFLRNRSLSNAR